MVQTLGILFQYINHLNTGLVWYSNSLPQSIFLIVLNWNGATSLDNFIHKESKNLFVYKMAQLPNHSISGPVFEWSTCLDCFMHAKSNKNFYCCITVLANLIVLFLESLVLFYFPDTNFPQNG